VFLVHHDSDHDNTSASASASKNNESSVGAEVMKLVQLPDLKQRLDTLYQQLERCQKSLSNYLETKRQTFPRFYFIGDDDLLEILGQANNIDIVNRHIKKLFAGIHSVGCTVDKKLIQSIRSSENEVVTLIQPVPITTNVEIYLSTLVECMIETLKQQTLECMKVLQNHAQAQADLYIQKYSSQILCLAAQVYFTVRCEAAIAIGQQQLATLLQQYENELQALTSIQNTDHLMTLKYKALVMDLIHHIDVIKQCMKDKVQSVDAWTWQKQLRFYLHPSTSCVVVRMVDAAFQYTYEYLGNVEKLVHTPLSDKCYLVLTSAMHLGYGGAPFGYVLYEYYHETSLLAPTVLLFSLYIHAQYCCCPENTTKSHILS
jgi:dynein heavy chain 2